MRYCSFIFLLLLIGFSAHAQMVSESTADSDSFAKWNVRFFPVALVTGVKAEVGHRMNNYEFNLQGKYIYQGFYWYRTYKSQLPTPFYKPSDGYRLMLSLEKRAKKENLRMISFGPKIGYEFINSETFDASSGAMLPGQSEDIQIERERYTGAFIVRGRSREKGAFVEFSAEFGLSYNESTTRKVFIDGDYKDVSTDWESYILPHILVGFAVGFGI